MQEFADALKSLQVVGSNKRTNKTDKPQSNKKNISQWGIVAGIIILLLVAGTWAIYQPISSERGSSKKINKSITPLNSETNIQTEQIDLLKEIKLPDDVVVGDWVFNSEGLRVNPKQFSRITVPISVATDYQLDLELTRKRGEHEINLILPVGNRTCMFSLGRDDWCGLQNVYDHEYGRVIQGHFPNNQRHHLTLDVTSSKQEVSIRATLNENKILDWSGAMDALTIRSDWQIPAKSFGLGAHYEQVIFHKLILQVDRGTAIVQNRWIKQKTEEYRDWKDLLYTVDVSQQTFTGKWKLLRTLSEQGSDKIDERKLVIRGGEFSRLILPVVPTGDYQLQVHMKRTARTGEVNLILPVGKAICMVSGGNDGNNFSIQKVNGEYWGVRKRGTLVNGKPHVIEVDVTLGKEDDATILLTIDNQEIFNWQGKQPELSLRQDWAVHPTALALGVHQDFTEFNKILFRSKTGTVYQLRKE